MLHRCNSRLAVAEAYTALWFRSSAEHLVFRAAPCGCSTSNLILGRRATYCRGAATHPPLYHRVAIPTPLLPSARRSRKRPAANHAKSTFRAFHQDILMSCRDERLCAALVNYKSNKESKNYNSPFSYFTRFDRAVELRWYIFSIYLSCLFRIDIIVWFSSFAHPPVELFVENNSMPVCFCSIEVLFTTSVALVLKAMLTIWIMPA